jgi:hypothetical protein
VDTIPKRIGRICLGVPLLYGLLPVLVGFFVLRERAAESVLLIFVGVLLFLGGTVMVSSTLWLLGTLGRSRLPLWVGGIASILNASIFAWATLTNVLPCSGPE